MTRWKVTRLTAIVAILAGLVFVATPHRARASVVRNADGSIQLDNGVINMQLNGYNNGKNEPMITSMSITGVQVVRHVGAGGDMQFDTRCSGCSDAGINNPTLGGDCNDTPSLLESAQTGYDPPNVGVPFVSAPPSSNGAVLQVQPRNYNEHVDNSTNPPTTHCYPTDPNLPKLDFKLGVSLGDGRSGGLPTQVAVLDMGMRVRAGGMSYSKRLSEVPAIFANTAVLPTAWWSNDGHNWTPLQACSLAAPTPGSSCDIPNQCGTGAMATNDVRKWPNGVGIGDSLPPTARAIALAQDCNFLNNGSVGMAIYSHAPAHMGANLAQNPSGDLTGVSIDGELNGSTKTVDPPPLSNDALASFTTLRRLIVVGNVGTISAAVGQSESLIRDWGNW